MNANVADPSDLPLVEGPAWAPLARICGALCFLVINPLLIWVWIDDPKFWRGEIDGGVVFMVLVTLGGLALGCLGLLSVFARTRVFRKRIETKWFRRWRTLRLADIQYVEQMPNVNQSFKADAMRMVFVLRVVRRDGKRVEICGGTPELGEFFLDLTRRYPRD